MLVLTRRLNEQIIIGGDVVITVVDIDRGKIRLAISAPEEVRIDRMEVHLANMERNKQCQIQSSSEKSDPSSAQ